MYEKQIKLASLMQLLSTIPPRLETFKNLKPEMHKNVTKQMKYACLINYSLLNKWWIVLFPRCPNYAKKILAILHSAKSAKHYLVWGKNVLTWCGGLWSAANKTLRKVMIRPWNWAVMFPWACEFPLSEKNDEVMIFLFFPYKWQA